MKDRTPLFSTLPGSQKAFFSFFLTSSFRSRRSILDSWEVREGEALCFYQKLLVQPSRTIQYEVHQVHGGVGL